VPVTASCQARPGWAPLAATWRLGLHWDSDAAGLRASCHIGGAVAARLINATSVEP
jgi:hypothetical protein